MKRPAFQFYPGDWLSDTALQSCSIGAQGLWIKLMCFLHNGEPYGFLRRNGHPLSDAEVRRLTGMDRESFEPLMTELAEARLFRRDEDGTLYSPRMVRDEARRDARAAGGPKSLEHPNVPKPKHQRDGGGGGV